MSGLELAQQFFRDAVAPVMARVAPAVRYTAGRFGARSDVFGLDDTTSRDHGWGPECMLLLEPAAFPDVAPLLDAALRTQLPVRFRGYPTNYRRGCMTAIDTPPVDHAVEIDTVEHYLNYHIGATAAAELCPIDWLAIDEQKLLEVTSGELFHDDLMFGRTRAELTFYPDDLRLHLISVEWKRIADEQAFPARAGSRGDEAGSVIVSARLAECAMRLGYYIDRVYPSYAKWFGSAFQRLACASELAEPVTAMLAAATWQLRDRAWADVLRRLVSLHERAGLLASGRYQPEAVYAGRPGTGIPALESSGRPTIGELIAEVRGHIADPEVSALPIWLGSINQVVACRDLEDDPSAWRGRLVALHHQESLRRASGA